MGRLYCEELALTLGSAMSRDFQGWQAGVSGESDAKNQKIPWCKFESKGKTDVQVQAARQAGCFLLSLFVPSRFSVDWVCPFTWERIYFV
jgi:hypothetical protein